MERLDLTDSGKQFVSSMKTCLDWLSLGGEVTFGSGHVVVMDDLGRLGFLVDRHDAATNEDSKYIIQLDSDTPWSFLVYYAKKMTEEDRISMADNCVLNQFNRKKTNGIR